MRLSRRRIIEMIVVPVIILSCGGILWWPYMDVEVKPWEQGRNVPETPPAEDRRVHAPHHFSIVAPLNWDWHVTSAEPDTVLEYPRMTLGPKQSFPRRCASIYITGPFDVSSDLSDCRETTFQGLPAFFQVETRPGTFDDPPQFWYSLFFQRSGDWYNLNYVGLLHQEELPPVVQQYFDTFRVETPADERLPDHSDGAMNEDEDNR